MEDLVVGYFEKLCPTSKLVRGASHDCLGEAYTVRMRLYMIAAYIGAAVAIVLALFVAFASWRAEQDRGRARRMAEHRMNARLLRLNI